MSEKIISGVIPAEAGDAFWQPGVQGNCITIKVSPWNIENTNHTVFLHELPKGGTVGEHAHDTHEEIFICLDGEGVMTIDEKDHLIKKHDVAFVAPLSKHSILATSESPLKLMVIISPTGLEDRLKLMGIAKKDHNESPPDSFDSQIGKQNSHGVV